MAKRAFATCSIEDAFALSTSFTTDTLTMLPKLNANKISCPQKRRKFLVKTSGGDADDHAYSPPKQARLVSPDANHQQPLTETVENKNDDQCSAKASPTVSNDTWSDELLDSMLNEILEQSTPSLDSFYCEDQAQLQEDITDFLSSNANTSSNAAELSSCEFMKGFICVLFRNDH